MSKKYRTTDKAVRCALWLAYDKKDGYKDDIISYREMVIDHIVPRYVFEDEQRKNETLMELGLDNSFERDSLENFLPTRRDPNGDKSNNIDIIQIKHCLNKAKKKKEQVEKLIAEYYKETDLITAAVNVARLADNEDKKQEVVDIIFDEEEEFGSQYMSRLGNNYRESISRVCVEANLPSIKDMTPGCLFEFRPVKLRACTVWVGHKELFEKLFVGNKETNLENRAFVSYKMEDGSYRISLGRCFFYLNENETKELCELIDRYNVRYFERLEELERVYSLDGMKINEYSEIKICTVRKSFCKIVFQAINYFVEYKKWDIFERNRMMIKVFTEENRKYNYGYHAIFYIRDEKTDFGDEEGDVGICLAPYYQESSFVVSSKEWWTPIQARKWLFEELFPKCLQWYAEFNRWKDYKNIDYISEAKKYYSLETSKKLHIEDRMDVNELARCISKLQVFFSVPVNRRVYFEEKSRGIYKILDVLLNCCTKKLYIQYFREKLMGDFNSEEQLREKVSNLCREGIKVVTYLQVDMLLRCCMECLENGNVKLNAVAYTEIWKVLDVLITEYNYHMQRERFLYRDSVK